MCTHKWIKAHPHVLQILPPYGVLGTRTSGGPTPEDRSSAIEFRPRTIMGSEPEDDMLAIALNQGLTLGFRPTKVSTLEQVNSHKSIVLLHVEEDRQIIHLDSDFNRHNCLHPCLVSTFPHHE
jgi:hypothetical protein